MAPIRIVFKEYYTGERLRNAVLHLVQAASDMGIGNLGRTKLVKLMFLADHASLNQQKRTISGVEYTYHNYGPFASEILQALDDMAGHEILEETRGLVTEKEKHLAYHYLPGDPPRWSSQLAREDSEIIEQILSQFGSWPLSRLLNYVYDMELMQDKEPLDVVLSGDDAV